MTSPKRTYSSGPFVSSTWRAWVWVSSGWGGGEVREVTSGSGRMNSHIPTFRSALNERTRRRRGTHLLERGRHALVELVHLERAGLALCYVVLETHLGGDRARGARASGRGRIARVERRQKRS
eukprot:29937-Pelagococcus_subviridis.AAC.6